MLPNAEDPIHLMGFDLYVTQWLVFLRFSFQVYFSFFHTVTLNRDMVHFSHLAQASIETCETFFKTWHLLSGKLIVAKASYAFFYL